MSNSSFSSLLSVLRQSQQNFKLFVLVPYCLKYRSFLSILYQEGFIRGFSQGYYGSKFSKKVTFFSNISKTCFGDDLKNRKTKIDNLFFSLYKNSPNFSFSKFRLVVFLKYIDQIPLIRGFINFYPEYFYWSYKNSLFFYQKAFSFSGFGVVILSTSDGFLSLRDAVNKKVGGRVILEIF